MLIVIGTLSTIAGLMFTAQSKSLVGPQSSFMYSNPEWTINGFMILGVGLAVLFSGIVIWIYTKVSSLETNCHRVSVPMPYSSSISCYNILLYFHICNHQAPLNT
jgi:hypothetical protein